MKAEENIKSAKIDMPIDVQMLKDLAIYLEGIVAGKGNLRPLGTLHLENLWNVIQDYQHKLLK